MSMTQITLGEGGGGGGKEYATFEYINSNQGGSRAFAVMDGDNVPQTTYFSGTWCGTLPTNEYLEWTSHTTSPQAEIFKALSNIHVIYYKWGTNEVLLEQDYTTNDTVTFQGANTQQRVAIITKN